MIDREKFQYFFEMGQRIVAEHKAQYAGIYYMKGGFLGKVLDNPITQIVSDVAAVASGNPELIPLINAGETTAGNLASGQSLGKSLGQGAISGAEAFGGQELAGAAANAFPETAGSLGLDAGGNSLTDILGQTSGAGSFTGAGTIGGDISNLFNGTASTPVGSFGRGASIDPSTGQAITGSPSSPGVGMSSTVAPGTGGSAVGAPAPGAAAIAAPGGGLFEDAGDVTSQFSQGLSGGQDFSSLGAGDVNGFTAANSPNVSTSGANPSNISPGAVAGSALSAADSNFLGNAANSAANTNVSAPGAIAGGAPPISSGKNFINNPSVNSFANMLESNPAALISGAGLGLSALKGNQPVKGEKQIDQAAAQATQQGTQLQSYLTNGTLPPGAQASINQAAESQKAAIRSRYAQMGGSGSSAMQQDLAAVDQWSQGQGSTLALQLLNSGIGESQLGSALYQDIAKNSLDQDKDLTSSIAAFASSLNGGYRPAAGT